jgi:hypothetical protein
MPDILPVDQQVAIAAEINRLKAVHPFVSNSQRIYVSALACVGRMVCPFQDLANGHLACAFAANRAVQFALSQPIDDEVDTRSLYSDLLHGRGVEITAGEPGAIIISPTTFKGGVTHHGHVGIFGERDGEHDLIYSNSSADATLGHWLQNYSLATWKADLEGRRGLQTHLFQVQ